MNEEDIVSRIDIMLTKIDKRRSDLCEAIGISKQSISTWKAAKSYPSVDTATKIAKYLNISVEWLVYGKINETDPSPKNIADFITQHISQLLPQEYYQKVPLIEKIVSKQKLDNWQNNRIYPTLDELIGVSSALNITLDELLNLKLHKHDATDEYFENRHLLKLAKIHSSHLMTYDAMYTKDQEYIDYISRRCFKMRRQIEGRDYDYSNTSDGKKQADPNGDIK